MKHVSFAEYEAAKAEIIGGVQYKESPTLEGNVIRKTYATEENGVFYEVNVGGRIEFWSDKHPESRIYDENAPTATPEPETPSYGETLYQKTRETVDTARVTDYEKFILNRAFEFETEEKFRAAYDRHWKASHGVLITLDEFLEEIGGKGSDDSVEVYDTIVELYHEKKLDAAAAYRYARNRWCKRSPEAIVAYQTAPGKWTVNNCGAEIAEDRARIEVCEEWGFEASRVKIIGTPYYDSTDWNFIRFDCAHMTWLMANGELYQVYH